MVPIDFFSLKSGEDGPAASSVESQLLLRGKATGRIVPGKVLEQQFQVGNRYLLLLTDDVPFEEALHISLLDHSLGVLDERALGHPYQAGVLEGVEPISSRQLRFSFGGQRWQLTVLESAKHLWGDVLRAQPRRQLQRLWTKRYLHLTPIDGSIAVGCD